MGKKHLIIITSLLVAAVVFVMIPYIIRPDRSVSPALETGRWAGSPIICDAEPPITRIPQEPQTTVDEEIQSPPHHSEPFEQMPVVEEQNETREQRVRRIRNSPEYRRLVKQYRELFEQRTKIINLIRQLDSELTAGLKRIDSEFDAAVIEFLGVWVSEHGVTSADDIPSFSDEELPEEIRSSTQRGILQQAIKEHETNEAALNEEIAQINDEMHFFSAQMREMLGE